jgi:hypothetical protein
MEAQQPNSSKTLTVSPSPALHVCESCKSDLVQPVEWHEAAPRAWQVTLECPNCHHQRNGTFSQEIVDELDETLDAGFTTLLAELQELMASNMADEIDRFVSALNADAILPEDF